MAILLLRHAWTAQDLGAHPRLDFEDSPLAPAGYRRALTVGTALAPLRVPMILSSDLRRAVETAHPWSEMSGAPISLQRALRPWDRRGLVGLGEEEVGTMLEWYVREPQREPPGGGESFAAYCDRFVPLVLAFLMAPGLFGLVTHSTGARVICALVEKGAPLCPDAYLGNACLEPGHAAIVTMHSFRTLPI